MSLLIYKILLREKDIWDLIGKELTEREIADKLSISLYTVKTHKNNISKKMGFKNKRRLTRAVNNYKV
jgi:DNA-binding CsgD family transcriptional regulator